MTTKYAALPMPGTDRLMVPVTTHTVRTICGDEVNNPFVSVPYDDNYVQAHCLWLVNRGRTQAAEELLEQWISGQKFRVP